MTSTYLNTVLGNPQYPVFCAISLLGIFILKYSFSDNKKKYPVLNPKEPFEWSNRRATRDFIANSGSLLVKARALYKKQPYWANTEWGENLVIPPEFLDSLKSNRQLDFMIPSGDDTHQYIPGFDPFKGDVGITTVINKYITKTLNKVTGPLSEETSLAMQQVFTDSTEWHAIQPQRDLMRIVSRVSSRVFMGEELCRDDEWVRVSGDYTLSAFATGDLLVAYPRWARPLVHWFMPECREVRRKLNDARRCLQPHLDRRNAIKREAAAQGKPCPFNDSIEWFEKEYSKHDPAICQIGISLVAYHTTSDLLMETLFNLCQHPELLKPLREEIVNVLSEEGWKKSSLNNLKLMDSVVKESQRLRPVLLGAFRRQALADITLPNGDVIKKGTRVVCDTTHMRSSEYYKDAATFDGYRYLKMRQTPGEDKHAHLVSTSSDHLGFGHGLHACPGRFFAANEIKIVLCHLLLKYDLKLEDGVVPTPTPSGFSYFGDGKAKILVRRRQEELDLESVET
ncbi:cytochrome P450 [Fusarium avenaceum]|nr:cytochrome P450 [Fusarium avenaceum]